MNPRGCIDRLGCMVGPIIYTVVALVAIVIYTVLKGGNG